MIASDIMTRRVHITTPQASVQEVAQLLYRERISGVPVIDESSGQIIGMITEADIIKNIERDDLKVAEVMSRQLFIVDEDTPVSEIAALLAERRIKRVPVVQAGRVVGIVSRADIVQAVALGHLVIRQW
ncbi:MAG TPA: CBS domain-containing protein [Ktedonobacteraceae bacterium]|nr:CBS domain-containing protein [Ktedonobacteraceae bacterium]